MKGRKRERSDRDGLSRNHKGIGLGNHVVGHLSAVLLNVTVTWNGIDGLSQLLVRRAGPREEGKGQTQGGSPRSRTGR
jgi:hypothetical protein